MLRQNLPNYITLGNLAAGCTGIQFILTGRPEWAPWCVVVAALLDFLDGFAARMLRAQSAIGKDLDSLADMVSFGVLPGFLAWELSISAVSDKTYLSGDEPLMYPIRFAFLLIPLLSAWRLAKFNNDPSQSETFKGLPTPANALFWAGLASGIYKGEYEMLYQPWVLMCLTVGMSLLLVAPLPMFSFKFNSFTWQNNRLRYLFLIVAIPLLFWLAMPGLAPMMLLYVLVSLMVFFRAKSGKSL
jgi:CDP-diacylglycerol---serine O-phosphatidyltransferase